MAPPLCIRMSAARPKCEPCMLVQGEGDAGYHEVRFDGAGPPSGVCFYRLNAGGNVEPHKTLPQNNRSPDNWGFCSVRAHGLNGFQRLELTGLGAERPRPSPD
jgi:hypothetical protein